MDRTRALRIEWADGATSVYPLGLLRRACPCAQCREERERGSSNPLRVVPAQANQAQMARAESAELVGHYALRIDWQDGHNTGIYDFDYLRQLTPKEVDAGPPER